MASEITDFSNLKREAALRALDYVQDGMKLGLGTGTTAEAFLDVLAVRVKAGLKIIGVPSSERTAQLCRTLGIALGTLEEMAPLDLDIDGADECDHARNLIKGAGGALLREKIVAASSKAMLVIADGSKLVERLGKFPLSIEVIEYGQTTTVARIAATAAKLGYAEVPIRLRMKDGKAFKTDSNNVIYDCAFGEISDAPALAAALSAVTGVVEHGLFIGLATTLVIAGADGVSVI